MFPSSRGGGAMNSKHLKWSLAVDIFQKLSKGRGSGLSGYQVNRLPRNTHFQGTGWKSWYPASKPVKCIKILLLLLNVSQHKGDHKHPKHKMEGGLKLGSMAMPQQLPLQPTCQDTKFTIFLQIHIFKVLSVNHYNYILLFNIWNIHLQYNKHVNNPWATINDPLIKNKYTKWSILNYKQLEIMYGQWR